MLVLTRRVGQEIVIAGAMRVKVLSVDRNQIRLGIDAPKQITVDRAEVHDRRADFGSDEVPAQLAIFDAIEFDAVEDQVPSR